MLEYLFVIGIMILVYAILNVLKYNVLIIYASILFQNVGVYFFSIPKEWLTYKIPYFETGYSHKESRSSILLL